MKTVIEKKPIDLMISELHQYLPKEIFDIHTHVYRASDVNPAEGEGSEDSVENEGTIQAWKTKIEEQVGVGRLKGGLFMPLPTKHCNIDNSNAFLLEQLKGNSESKGLIMVSPDSLQDKMIEYLDNNNNIYGFKPYHLFSKYKPTFESPVSGYLPEWVWKLADERRLIITLHLVKYKALADPENQQEIIEKCKKYPGAKIILAHAARGFNHRNTLEGILKINGLQNIWFDTSAICEPAALKAILNEFGPQRLLWGSDFPVSQAYGKCVSLGDGFAWLQEGDAGFDKLTAFCRPIPVGIESLLALKEATDDFGLNSNDLNDIFHDNALRLLGMKKNTMSVTQDLYMHAKEIIPGGTQLLSKRPEMLAPGQWPAYFREARGCEVWDLDGKHYYDMSSNGIASCLLGFRDRDVTKAVKRRIALGSMCTLNPPEEVELAEMLCEIHPWAQQARFTRTGGETASVAVRIARATTDRSIIAICGYHGWHDWYLAANLGEDDTLRGHLLPGLDSFGVPSQLRNTTAAFSYNCKEEFITLMDRYGDKLAAVVMEPCRNNEPEAGFLELVRDSTRKYGALMIFDEISVGWRICFGGAHLKYGVNPDMAIFSKALGNGHPIGAVIGTREAMAGAQSSFISSTYWTESVGPVAAVATLKKMKDNDIPKYVADIGKSVIQHWKSSAARYKLPVLVDSVHDCLAHFAFKHESSEELRTLYTQMMLERGFLAGNGFNPTFSHNEQVVSYYGSAVEEVFCQIAEILKSGDIAKYLKGPVAHSGFKRLV